MRISSVCLQRLKDTLIGLFAVMLLLVPCAAEGGGLTVEPGGLLLQNVPLSTVYDLYKETGIAIKILNGLDRQVTYRITARKPSHRGSEKWMEGYQEIPDSSYLFFDRNNVVIEPQGAEEFKLFLKIPDDPRYYNQHWAVTVAVEGQPSPGEVFALAAYLPFEIETESRNSVGEKPWGKLGIEPSSLTLNTAGKEKIRIYNNEGKKQKYQLGIGIPGKTTSMRQVGLTRGYRDIPDVKWIGISHDELAVKQDGVREVSLTARLPDKPAEAGPWETFLWIESDSGEKAFVRIDIEQ